MPERATAVLMASMARRIGLVENLDNDARSKAKSSKEPALSSSDQFILDSMKRRTPIAPDIPSCGPYELEFVYFVYAPGIEGPQPEEPSLPRKWTRRSHCKRVGDFVFRLGVANSARLGDLAVFLEVVPALEWGDDWEFSNIKCRLSCYSCNNNDEASSSQSDVTYVKHACMHFTPDKIGYGWDGFISHTEITSFISPSGFICLRAQILDESLTRVWRKAQPKGKGKGRPSARIPPPVRAAPY